MQPPSPKPLQWMGTSHRDVTNFPDRARSDAGYGLHLVQQGRMPADWKPFETVGAGTYEIRIRTHEGGNVQHRVLYVAKFPEAVYVLHAFAKTTRETSAHDVEVGRARYAEMLRLRKRQLRD